MGNARKRVIQHVSNLSGGGGGGPAPTGTLLVGPDFGEKAGNDNNTFSASAQLKMPTIKLNTNLRPTVSAKLSKVILGTLPSGTTGVSLAGTAEGAPYWQSANSVGGTNLGGGLISVTAPSGTQSGDLLVAFVSVSGTNASVNTPSGWTLIASETSSTSPAIYAFWRLATASSSYSWTSSGTGVINHVAGINRITGFDSTPINASNTSSGSAADPVTASVTTTAANCLVLHGVAQTSSATAYTFTPPSGFAERWDTSGGTVSPVSETSATRVFAATGATGTHTYNSSASLASQYATITVAVEPGVVTL